MRVWRGGGSDRGGFKFKLLEVAEMERKPEAYREIDSTSSMEVLVRVETRSLEEVCLGFERDSG